MLNPITRSDAGEPVLGNTQANIKFALHAKVIKFANQLSLMRSDTISFRLFIFICRICLNAFINAFQLMIS